MSEAGPEQCPEASSRWQQLLTTHHRWQRVCSWVVVPIMSASDLSGLCCSPFCMYSTTVWHPPCMLQEWTDLPPCCRQIWQDEVECRRRIGDAARHGLQWRQPRGCCTPQTTGVQEHTSEEHRLVRRFVTGLLKIYGRKAHILYQPSHSWQSYCLGSVAGSTMA